DASGRSWFASDLATHRAFFDRILAALEDDAPRLIYADWLEESSDSTCVARAEFIRVQCRLAGMGPDDPARADLEERAQDLLCAHEAVGLGPYIDLIRDLARNWEPNDERLLRHWGFERGFLTADVYTPADVLDLAPALFEAG